MLQPKFWRKKNITSFLLCPVSYLYFLIACLRQNLRFRHRFDKKIICVGNVTVGGAGKTPIVAEIVNMLQARNLKPAIVSRGYKGEITKPTKVDRLLHTVNFVGDEPLMLSNIAPTYVAARRPDAVKMAIASGADIIVMDDGMQNKSVVKNVNILVIDGKFGIGNGFMLPAGPLREPLLLALYRANLVVLVDADETNFLKHFYFKIPALQKKIMRARITPSGQLPDKSLVYVAFAGIGNPDKFFGTLETSGYNVVKTFKFADHHNYTDAELNHLINVSENLGATLITTQKDSIRLPEFARHKVKILNIKILFEDEVRIANV